MYLTLSPFSSTTCGRNKLHFEPGSTLKPTNREHPWGPGLLTLEQAQNNEPTSLRARDDYEEPSAFKSSQASGASQLGATSVSCFEQCTWLRDKIPRLWLEKEGKDEGCTAAHVWFENGCWSDGTPMLSNEHYEQRPVHQFQRQKLATMFAACDFGGVADTPSWITREVSSIKPLRSSCAIRLRTDTSHAACHLQLQDVMVHPDMKDTENKEAGAVALQVPKPYIPWKGEKYKPNPKLPNGGQPAHNEGQEVLMPLQDDSTRYDKVVPKVKDNSTGPDEESSPPPSPPPPPPPYPPPKEKMKITRLNMLLDFDARNIEFPNICDEIVKTCTTLVGWDYYGNDREWPILRTREECNAKCVKLDWCQAYAYDERPGSSRRCWLKQASNNLRRLSGVVTGRCQTTRSKQCRKWVDTSGNGYDGEVRATNKPEKKKPCVDKIGGGVGGDNRGRYDHRAKRSTQCMHYAKVGLCSLYSSKCPLTCGRCQYDPDADKWANPSRGRQVKDSPVTIGAALEIEFDVKVEGTVFGWSNILHGGKSLSQMEPSIGLHHHSCRLQVCLGSACANGNRKYMKYFGVRHVEILVVNDFLILKEDGDESDAVMVPPGSFQPGDRDFYFSSPWMPSAHARIRGLTIAGKPIHLKPPIENEVLNDEPGVGGWGGSCACPDGRIYQVGDYIDHCGSLACVGGVGGQCHRRGGPWSRRKVICKPSQTAWYTEGPQLHSEKGATYLRFAKDGYVAIRNAFFKTAVPLSSLSVEVWFRTSFNHQPAAYQAPLGSAPVPGGKWHENWAFLDFDRSEQFNFFLRSNDGRLHVGTPGLRGFDYFEVEGKGLNDGKWHHAVFTLAPGGELVIYRDGRPSKLNAQPGREPGGGASRYGFIGDGSEAVTFDGKRNNIGLTGDIAVVRMHQGTLTPTEVRNNFLLARCNFTTEIECGKEVMVPGQAFWGANGAAAIFSEEKLPEPVPEFYNAPIQMSCTRVTRWSGALQPNPQGWVKMADVQNSVEGVKSCAVICHGQRFAYFGLQCPGELVGCQCTNNLDAGELLPENQCNANNDPSGQGKCIGPYVQGPYILGAQKSTSVYKTTEGVARYRHPMTASGPMYCKTGGHWTRMPNDVPNTFDGAEKCGHMCQSQGFKFFALECPHVTITCLCAHTLDDSVSVDESKCNQMGQPPKTRAFKNPTMEPSYEHKGQYRDTGNRALRYGPQKYGYDELGCRKACEDYTYFALQNGNGKTGWCCCDNDWQHVIKYGRAPSSCTSKTGGPWCNAVFKRADDPATTVFVSIGPGVCRDSKGKYPRWGWIKGSESEVGEKCTADPLCIAFHQADSGAYRVFCKESNTKTSALCSSDGDGAVDVTEGMLGEPQATNVKNECFKKGDEALSAQKCSGPYSHSPYLLGGYRTAAVYSTDSAHGLAAIHSQMYIHPKEGGEQFSCIKVTSWHQRSGWSRPAGDVTNSIGGVEDCGAKCRKLGYAYFGLECPRPLGIHCQCSQYLQSAGNRLPDTECNQKNVPGLTHCTGPYTQGPYMLGSHGTSAVYVAEPQPSKPPARATDPSSSLANSKIIREIKQACVDYGSDEEYTFQIACVAACNSEPSCGGATLRHCVAGPPDDPPKNDKVEENAEGVGGWGGSCTCPDGSVYMVGDHIDYCQSLACYGGTAGVCNKHDGVWSRRKATCRDPMGTYRARCWLVQGDANSPLSSVAESHPDSWGYKRKQWYPPPPPPIPEPPKFSSGCIKALEPVQGKVRCLLGSTVKKVLFASYGTPWGTCGGKFQRSWCHAEESEAYVRRACVGRKTCSLGRFDKLLGDPCPGWSKWFQVEVECENEVFEIAATGEVCIDEYSKAHSFPPPTDDTYASYILCQTECETRAGCVGFDWSTEGQCITHLTCFGRDPAPAGGSYISIARKRPEVDPDAVPDDSVLIAPPPPPADCYDGDGRDYRGRISVTKSGRKCQWWSLQSPHTHTRTPANYPNAGLGMFDGNACRNPDGESGPWCFTKDPNTRWELCSQIPRCQYPPGELPTHASAQSQGRMRALRGWRLKKASSRRSLQLLAKDTSPPSLLNHSAHDPDSGAEEVGIPDLDDDPETFHVPRNLPYHVDGPRKRSSSGEDAEERRHLRADQLLQTGSSNLDTLTRREESLDGQALRRNPKVSAAANVSTATGRTSNEAETGSRTSRTPSLPTSRRALQRLQRKAANVPDSKNASSLKLYDTV